MASPVANEPETGDHTQNLPAHKAPLRTEALPAWGPALITVIAAGTSFWLRCDT